MRSMIVMILTMALCISAFAVSPLHNPALNKVKELEPSKHAPLELIKDGRIQFAIAADWDHELKFKKTQQSVRKSVEALQLALKKCTGADVPVISAKDRKLLDSFAYVIVLGKSSIAEEQGVDLGKLPPEGFVVKTFAKGVIIAGDDGSGSDDFYQPDDLFFFDKNGTLHGTYDFIERFLGIRYYFPGIGLIFPELKELKLNAVSYYDAPVYAWRGTHKIARIASEDAVPKECGEFENNDWQGIYRTGGHKSRTWVDTSPLPKPLAEKFPDRIDTIFYRAPNGKLFCDPKVARNRGYYYDITNLEFADILLETYRKYYAGDYTYGWVDPRVGSKHPNRNEVCFAQCDAVVNGMDTEVIRKLKLIPDARKGNRDGELSDVMARFVIHLGKKVEKEFPGKRLCVLAYLDYLLPPMMPEYREYPSNVDIKYCAFDLPGKIVNPQIRQYHLDALKDWYKVLGDRPVSALYLYNERMNSNPFARAVVSRYMADTAKAFGQYAGRDRLYFDSWGPMQWEYYYAWYLVWRIQWNPEFDLDAALDEQWKLLYGKAAPYTKALYDLLRERWEKVMALDGDRKNAYHAGVLKELEEIIHKAEAAVEPGSLEAQRLKLFMKPWPNAIKQARTFLSNQKPSYKTVKLNQDETIIVDGLDKDLAWQRARDLVMDDPFGAAGAKTDRVAGKLLWDNKGIYGFFTYKGPKAFDPKRAIYNNDSLEIFIVPGMKKEQAYQFIAGADGSKDTGIVTGLAKREAKELPGFQFAVKENKDSWNIEWFIPWKSISGFAASDYMVFPANFVANRTTGVSDCTSFSPTLGDNFKCNNFDISKYGYIKLLGHDDR